MRKVLVFNEASLVPRPPLAIFIACYVVRAGEGLGTRLQ